MSVKPLDDLAMTTSLTAFYLENTGRTRDLGLSLSSPLAPLLVTLSWTQR